MEELNAGLEAQNEELRGRKQAGDQDRQFLISQLSAVQRDNAKCRQALRDFSRPRPPPTVKEEDIKSSGPMASDARELRTKELRKLEAGLDHRQRLLMNRRREAADHARSESPTLRGASSCDRTRARSLGRARIDASSRSRLVSPLARGVRRRARRRGPKRAAETLTENLEPSRRHRRPVAARFSSPSRRARPRLG